MYSLLDPQTRREIDQVRARQGGSIAPMDLIFRAGSSEEKNLKLWAAISKNTIADYKGERTGLFSAPSMHNIRLTANRVISDMNNKDFLNWGVVQVGKRLPYDWIPDDLLGATIRSQLVDSHRGNPALGSGVAGFTGGTQTEAPGIMHYTAPAMALGAPVALGGILAGKPLLGLTGAAVIGAAGAGYGAARQNGWKGWEPINSAADSFNGLFSSKTSETSKTEKAESIDPASKLNDTKKN